MSCKCPLRGHFLVLDTTRNLAYTRRYMDPVRSRGHGLRKRENHF